MLAAWLHAEGRMGEEKTALQKSIDIYRKLVHADPNDKKVVEKMSLVQKSLAAFELQAKESPRTTAVTK
jgi:hypothetical protein